MRRARAVRVMVAAGSALCLWSATDTVAAQGQKPVHILVVDYPRPVVKAVDEVEERFGRVVTYEDTLYVHPDDIRDVTEEVSRSNDRSKRVLGMRGGNLDVQYTPIPGTAVDVQVAELLDEVLADS